VEPAETVGSLTRRPQRGSERLALLSRLSPCPRQPGAVKRRGTEAFAESRLLGQFGSEWRHAAHTFDEDNFYFEGREEVVLGKRVGGVSGAGSLAQVSSIGVVAPKVLGGSCALRRSEEENGGAE
jgi:hypothetical protein